MKKLTTLLSLFLLIGSFSGKAQIFWVENFESGSTSGLVVSSYSGPNGAWTLAVTGTEGAEPNPWYVSCAENGHAAGGCGTACTTGPTVTGASLHIGSDIGTFGDNGASYDAGGLCGLLACPQTDRRAESPTINCTGKININLAFNYIENGQGAIDDGSVYYSPDGGTTWSLLVNTPKTTLCGGQGLWAHYSIALPVSANNNPNVKIGFRWVNNDDGTGTDPSFAVDSVNLSTPSTTTGVNASFTKSATTICEDSCITFTSTSTGTIDSIRWIVPGASISTSTTSPFTTCFPASGSSSIALLVYGGLSFDSAMATITVNPAPHPVITATGHTLTVSGTYTTYQWTKNDTAIVGATNNTYTYTGTGSFQVIVDSGGCKGASNAIVHTLGVVEIASTDNRYAVAQSGNDAFTLYASQILNANLDVRVYDATGRLLLQDNWTGGSDRKQFNTPGLTSGIYIIRIGNADGSAILKWLKQ